MTIKVKDASQRAAVPASAAQIAEIQADLSILPAATIQTLIDAKSSLGALAGPVQDLIDLTSITDKARANHTGVDPAANVSVILPSGIVTDLQTYISTLEIRLTTLGTTAPQNTVQPTAPTGTLTVGSTLTAVTGTWTGASSYNYVWYRVNTTSGALTATGGTAATYVLQAADAGFKMAVSVAGVSAALIIAAPVISAVTGSAVGATLPTISVAPAVTPSGSQAVGVTLTSTTGTWNNASGAVYTYQWTLDGAVISGAISNIYVLIIGQEGKAVVCRVLATTTQGPAAATAASNTITVASSPALTNSAAPSFTGTVTEGTPNTIIPGTWSQTVDASRTWRIYIAAGSGGLVTPYATITGTSGTYNPTNDSFFQTQTGLSAIAGQSVYVDEIVTYLGVPYTSPKSTVKVIAAISATLATTTDNTGLSWTQNSAITAVKPVSATGGTTPYSYAITPSTTALPAGLTLNSSTGIISGTPTVVSLSTTYSITVTDAAGSPATSVKTFTAAVSDPSITALNFATFTGAQAEAPSDSDSTGYGTKNLASQDPPPLTRISTITRGGVARLSAASTVDGLAAITHRVVSGDPLRNGGNRSEISYDNYNFANGEDIWFAQAIKFGTDCALGTSGDMWLIQQTHQEATTSGQGNPFGLTYVGANTGSYLQGLNWIVNNAGNDVKLYNTAIVINQWMRLVTHYRSGNSGNNPILEAWVAYGTGSYTKLSVLSGQSANQPFGDPLSTPGSNNDWPKSGTYKYTTGAYGVNNSRTTYSSGLFAGKGTNLLANAQAALASYAI